MSNKTVKQLTATLLTLPAGTSSESLFSQLAKQPWAMWLDSSEGDHVDSRYDIIVWQPSITLTTQGATTTICYPNSDNSQQQSSEDPLLLLKQTQQALFADTVLPDQALPFKGGAVGYFAYDLGRRFEKIPQQNTVDIHAPDMAVGIYQHAIIFDKQQQSFQLLCLEQQQPALIDFCQQLAAANLPKVDSFQLTSTWQSNMSAEQYQQKFQQVQAYLRSGDCYQINLAQRFNAHYKGNEFQAYQALRTENKAPFSGFLRFEQHAVLSISPERFLLLDDTKVQTKPIKGTRPRHSDKQVDQKHAIELQNASKDRAENLMIVDLLRNDISKVCQPGSVKVPALFAIESFPAVHHLVSTVEGEIQTEFDGSDLLRGAFPGGSITGAPKIRAMEIIEELEPNQRSVYCGSIAYFSACGNMDSSITIRTLVCQNQQIYCWAGGGLVADSHVDSEYQETYDKVNKILPILTQLNN